VFPKNFEKRFEKKFGNTSWKKVFQRLQFLFSGDQIFLKKKFLETVPGKKFFRGSKIPPSHDIFLDGFK